MSFVDYEVNGQVGIITIDRPKALNALNSQVLDDLSAVLDGVDVNTDVVTGTDLHHDVDVVGVFRTRQNLSREMSAGGFHFGFVPHVNVVFFERF